MKKLVFLLIALMPIMAFAQKAKIEFESTSHNFGTISEQGGEAVYNFSFKNTGNVPLILTNVRAGCGCTTPTWDRQPVAPGGSGNIKVAFNPLHRPGSFVKSITVNSNSETPVVSLTVRGNVSRKPLQPYEEYRYTAGSVKIITNNINLGNIKNTQKLEKSIEVVNPEKATATIEVVSDLPYLKVNVTPAVLNKDQKGKISIVYDAQKKNDWGFVSDKIPVKVNGKIAGEILVTASISEDFSHYNENPDYVPVAVFSENEVVLTDLEPNTTQTHDFYIQNTGKSDLIIHKLKTSDDQVSVNVAKKTIKPGKKVKATVTLKVNKSPQMIKLIQFTINDPKNPVISYKINAKLK